MGLELRIPRLLGRGWCLGLLRVDGDLENNFKKDNEQNDLDDVGYFK